MAPVGENVEINGFSSKKKDETDNKESLWSAILGEVQTRGNTKLPSCKSVLVLGDNESGKTTLIAKLQGVEDPKKGSGLEFAYIDLRDEYRDDHTRLSVWVLDGDPSHAQLLRFALSEESFPHTLVMFVVAMTTPWGVLDQLQTWATVLQDHIDKLKLSADDLQEAKHKYIKKWQDYVEPGDELEQGSPMRRTSRNLDEEDTEILPLGEGILTRNLGLDVVVVVTKTDYMTTLEKDYDYRAEHFDFIQQWIRRFCLQYGAALFYTSAKEDKNCDLLYKYLMHRIYGFPFRTPALVVEKDAVLIPSGWDNMKKISILYENMQSMKPDDYYRDVIVQPVIRKPVTRESEMQAEDEQSFLMRQLQLLQQGAPALRQESPLRTPAGVQKSADRRATGSRGVQGQLGLPKKIDGSKAGVTGSGEGVLENFFNSLPYKKTRAGTTTQKMPGKTMLRVAEVRSWHVIFPNGLKKNVVTFVNTLCHTGRTMGMNFPDPVYKPVHFNQLRSYFEAINSCVIEENPSILLVILPNKSPHRYGVIKKRCLGEWSVPTQLILNRTLTLKNLPTIATKVVIQMNCKLGGAPWTVNIPSKSLMVIGFDVYHKASKENPSIGVMVASQDPEMSRYFTQVNHYHNEEELSYVLSSSVCKAARRFAQLNGSLPRKVIVYRDGVGEGQIPSVHQHEVQKLESQLKKLYGDVKCEMAFVIVTKRINTLFFHHRDNPPPGTVVDDVVTLPDRYDFFLVSQSVCVGTASPVSYNVIHDATPLTADQIQRLTYKLTHLYYNWNGTVRVPAPVLYAHKLAYLVGQVTHSLPSQQMAQLLYFL